MAESSIWIMMIIGLLQVTKPQLNCFYQTGKQLNKEMPLFYLAAAGRELIIRSLLRDG